MSALQTEDMKFKLYTFGDPEADTLLLQMVDDHDMEVIEQEVDFIRELTGGARFCLKAVKVNSWNGDLSPWPAEAVFGNEGFGDGAAGTLEFLLNEVLGDPARYRRIIIGGYSLAGLFALWAGFQTDVFDGVAAASPSVWFPDFTEYMRTHTMFPGAVYLSLGDKEEKTRNRVMSRVGDAARSAYAILQEAGKNCVLEWNKGNHFREPDLRTAKAFAWVMEQVV